LLLLAILGRVWSAGHVLHFPTHCRYSSLGVAWEVRGVVEAGSVWAGRITP
jgi:hypothetical protein